MERKKTGGRNLYTRKEEEKSAGSVGGWKKQGRWTKGEHRKKRVGEWGYTRHNGGGGG
jgi:hypothetical protein